MKKHLENEKPDSVQKPCPGNSTNLASLTQLATNRGLEGRNEDGEMMKPWECTNNLCQVDPPQNPIVFKLWTEAKRLQWILDKATADGDFEAQKAARHDLLEALDRLLEAEEAAK